MKTIPALFLTHTCTIQRRSRSGTDVDGRAIYTWSNNATEVPCRYLPQTKVEIGPDVEVHRQAPRLIVGPSVDITEDDRVTDIVRTSDSATLEAGPVQVTSVIDPGGEGHHLEVELERIS